MKEWNSNPGRARSEVASVWQVGGKFDAVCLWIVLGHLEFLRSCDRDRALCAFHGVPYE